MRTFNLFRILSFRLELRWPSDVNREVTIFCATPAKASGTHVFCTALTVNNLRKTAVTDTQKFEGTWHTPLLAYRWQSPVYEKAMLQMMLYINGQNSYKQCIKTEFWRASAHTLAIKHAIHVQGALQKTNISPKISPVNRWQGPPTLSANRTQGWSILKPALHPMRCQKRYFIIFPL